MEVVKVVWWQHPTKYGVSSSAKVHQSLHVDNAGNITVDEIEGLSPEIINGF